MIREKLVPVIWLMLAAIIIGASIGFSARANAQPGDDLAYITTLDYFDVAYTTPAAVIELGHAVCTGLGRGLTPIGVITIAPDSGWNQTDAAHLVGAAIGAYCDEFSYLISPNQRGALV